MSRPLSKNPVEQDVRELLDGRVRLYRRRDSGKVWHYRIWIKEAKKYIRKSTGTPLFEEANQLAEDAFYDARAKQRQNLPVFNKTFKEIYDLALLDEERKIERGEMSEDRLYKLKRGAMIYYLPFFGNRQITSITSAVIQQFWEYRMDFWKQPNADEIKKKYGIYHTSTSPKGSTLFVETRILEMVFNKAEALNYISGRQRPNTSPPAKKETNRYPALTMEQWKKMRDFMANIYRKENCRKVRLRARNLLYFYCSTMVATGMRVADLRNVKWKNLTLFKDNSGMASTLFQVYGKGNQRDVIAKAYLYTILTEWREHPLNKFTEDDDYIFPSDKGEPLTTLGPVFETMKENAEKTDLYNGISEDYMGDKIVLYSLRHTYATFQRMYFGTSFEDLSVNMGNSPEILRNHYVMVKAPDIARRLNQLPYQMFAATPKKVPAEVQTEKKFMHGIFGKDVEQDPMYRLLDGQISKEEYSEIVAENKHNEA